MNDEALYDTRLIRHNIRRQKITTGDVDARLAELNDDSAEGQETETRFTGTVEARRKTEAD